MFLIYGLEGVRPRKAAKFSCPACEEAQQYNLLPAVCMTSDIVWRLMMICLGCSTCWQLLRPDLKSKISKHKTYDSYSSMVASLWCGSNCAKIDQEKSSESGSQ